MYGVYAAIFGMVLFVLTMVGNVTVSGMMAYPGPVLIFCGSIAMLIGYIVSSQIVKGMIVSVPFMIAGLLAGMIVTYFPNGIPQPPPDGTPVVKVQREIPQTEYPAAYALTIAGSVLGVLAASIPRIRKTKYVETEAG